MPLPVTRPRIKLLVGGGEGGSEYVELLDESGKQLYVERGHNDEHMDERVWDVSRFRGRMPRIRFVWGHINVGHIRCSN